MDQTSIDLKIRPDEKTTDLTFRPVYRDIPQSRYRITPDIEGRWVRLLVNPRLFSVFEMSGASV